MNVRFGYIYRDAANYKKGAEVVFRVENQLSINQVVNRANKLLSYGVNFIAEDLSVPEVFLYQGGEYSFDDELDHDAHESCGFRVTTDPVTDEQDRSIEAFVALLESEMPKALERLPY